MHFCKLFKTPFKPFTIKKKKKIWLRVLYMSIQKLLLLPGVVPKQRGCTAVPRSMLILLQLLLIADIVTKSGPSTTFTAVVALRIHWHYLNGVPTTP